MAYNITVIPGDGIGKEITDSAVEVLKAADKKFGYIHPCCTYPESDMEIDIPISEV